MTETAQSEERLKAIRGARPPVRRGSGISLGALKAHQIWFWRNTGLVLAMLLAMLIAALTLSPLPAAAQLTTGIDKVYHFLAFAALIFPLILTDSRRWPWAVPLCLFYGGLIEFIQPSFGRTAEWLDFGADVTGVLAGAALAEILHDRIRDRFFAVETGEGDAEDAEAEAQRLEAMRVELMDELRVVLREELTHLQSETPEGKAPEAGSAEAPAPAGSGAPEVRRVHAAQPRIAAVNVARVRPSAGRN